MQKGEWADYGYTARIIGEKGVYQVTGDAYGAESEDQAVEWMLRELGREAGEDPARCVVTDISIIRL